MWTELSLGCLHESSESEGNWKEVYLWKPKQGDCVFSLSVLACSLHNINRTKNLKEALQLFLAKETSSYILLASLESESGIVIVYVFPLRLEVVSGAETSTGGRLH